MKRILLTSLMVAFLGVIIAAPVSAEDAESTATVGFTTDNSVTPPVDPENPDEPGIGPGTGMEGPLSLDYVPSLSFGDQDLTAGIETYNALELKPFVQVTDKRGTGEGWEVKASISDFTDVTTGTKTIAGAVMNFNNADAITTTSNTSTAPNSKNFALTAGGAPVSVVSAAADQGMGTWVNRWFATNLGGADNDNVTLTLNTANAYAEQYAATITWSIELAP